MKYLEEELYGEIRNILNQCVEHYLLYKAFYECINDTIVLEEKELLVMTCNAHIQMYITEWCKVFGTDQETNFKRLGCENLFVDVLDKKYNISREQFDDYINEVKPFRNKYVAHKENIELKVPNLSLAQKAIIVLDGILQNNAFDIPFGTIEEYLHENRGKYKDIVKRCVNYEE